jgi:hypothetical protein
VCPRPCAIRAASLTEDEVQRLFDAIQRTLLEWAERLRREAGERFPEKVTAFHEGMAVPNGMENRAPLAGRRSRGLLTRTTRRTTTRVARPVGGSSPTAHCRACCAETGRARSRRWKGCAAVEAKARAKTPTMRGSKRNDYPTIPDLSSPKGLPPQNPKDCCAGRAGSK